MVLGIASLLVYSDFMYLKSCFGYSDRDIVNTFLSRYLEILYLGIVPRGRYLARKREGDVGSEGTGHVRSGRKEGEDEVEKDVEGRNERGKHLFSLFFLFVFCYVLFLLITIFYMQFQDQKRSLGYKQNKG